MAEAEVVAQEKEVAPAPQKKQKNYFVQTLNRYVLDDGESFIEHKPLNEGLFQDYQDLTSKIKLDRTGENTELDIRPGVQRKFLLESLVTGWNIVDEENKPVPYSARRLATLPPEIIQGLLEDIYKKNPVLGRDEESSDEEDAAGKAKPK